MKDAIEGLAMRWLAKAAALERRPPKGTLANAVLTPQTRAAFITALKTCARELQDTIAKEKEGDE